MWAMSSTAQGHVFGDGVNIASRIEQLAGPGDITISEQVHEAVRNKQGIRTEFLGRKQLKSVDQPVDAYLVSGEEIETPDLSELDERGHRLFSGRWPRALGFRKPFQQRQRYDFLIAQVE